MIPPDRRILPAAQAALVDKRGVATPTLYDFMRRVVQATGLTPDILQQLQDLLARFEALKKAVESLDLSQYTKRNANEVIGGQWEFRQPILGADGTEERPEFTFRDDLSTGLYRLGDGNIGVATLGERRLDIDTERIDFTLPMHGPDGSAAAPTYSFTNYPTNGMYVFTGHATEKEIGFGTDGVHRMDISSLGIDAAVPFRSSGGSVTAPGYDFWGTAGASVGSGMYLSGTNFLGWSVGGTNRMTLTSAQLISVGVVRGPNGNAVDPTYSFSSDTGTGMYRAGSSVLGFATNSVARLSISTTAVTSTLPIFGANGSVGTPAFSFANDANNGMYLAGTDTLGFSAGGTLALSLASTAVRPAVQVAAIDGTSVAPSYAFANDLNTGVLSGGADILHFVTGGSLALGLGAAGELLDATGSPGSTGQVPMSQGSGSAWTWGAGGGGGGGGGVAYVNTSIPAGNTVANDATETAFESEYTLIAGQLQAGSVVRVKLFGTFGTDAVAPTLRLRVNLGASTVLDTGDVTLTPGLSDAGWTLSGLLVCFDAGASGEIEAQGLAEFATGPDGQLVNLANASTFTIDTTDALTLSATVEWGAADADNTITLREFAVELLDVVSPVTAAPASASYLTLADETTDLPNSTRAVAGSNISFDTSTPGQVVINSTSGGGTPAVLRGTDLQTANADSYTLTLPTGAAVGDLAFIFTNHGWAANTPSGWTAINSLAGTNTNGYTFAKVLDAGDISAGTVTITYTGTFQGTAVLLVFEAGTYTDYAVVASNRTTATQATYAFLVGTLVPGLTLVTYGGARANGAVTFTYGTTQESTSGTNASAAVSTYTPSSPRYLYQTVAYASSTQGTYSIGLIVNGT